MKRSILWAAIAAVAMSGCSSDESTQGSSQKALSFGTYVEKATRGQNAILTTGYPKNGRFLVFGYNDVDLTNSPLLNYMREVVTFDGTNYTYFPIHYWPDNTKISFFAIHPADDVISSTIPSKLNDQTNKVLPSIAFTVNSDPLAQADLMMASALNQTGTPSTVNFAFGHQLTRIGFGAKLAEDYNSKGDYIRIKTITISNVANAATFGFDPTTGAASETTPPATTDFIHSFSLDYTKNMKNSGSVTSTGSFDQVNLDNSYLLMVPADYSTATTGIVGDNSHATITVNYDVECADGTTSSHTITKALNTLVAPVNPLQVGSIWKANQAITYNMTISLTAVSFSTSITDWDTTTVPATSIN
jgi:hypothetical protein